MPGRNQDLLSLLETQVSRYSHRKLYTFLDKDGSSHQELTYADVYQKALAVAATLQQREPQLGPIALLYPHGPDFIVAFLGAILAGSWPMPLSKPRGQDWSNVFNTIAVSGATVVLTLSTTRKLIPEALRRASHVQVICTDASDFFADAEFWQRPDVQPDDIAFIQYTSGSTSRPRGVVVTHANVLHNSESIRRSFGCSPLEICVSWLPFHHDMGLIGHVIQSLYTAMPNYFLSPMDFLGNPLRWLSAISRYGGTISGAPNFAYALCAERMESDGEEDEALDLSSWRLAYCGSERIVPTALKRFSLRFRDASFKERAFFPCYGMAESTLFVCGQYGVTCSKKGSYPAVGKVAEEASIAIVDPEKRIRLPDGDVGEVWLRSSSISPGYFNEPEATRKVFHQKLQEESGYMRTGDLGFIHNGALHFVGRLKNVVKRRGRSFHAEDIETHVVSALLDRGISRCATFEVPYDEEEALVLLLEHDGKTDTALMSAVTEDASALVCEVFGIVPDIVRMVAKRSLPLTTSGKLQRNVCRDLLLTEMRSESPCKGSAPVNKESLHESA